MLFSKENIKSQNRGLNVPCFVAVSGAGVTVSGLIAKVFGMHCTPVLHACILCLGGLL